MPRTRTPRRVTTRAAAAATVCLVAATAAPGLASAAPMGLTVEEQRLTTTIPGTDRRASAAFIEADGLDQDVARFVSRLRDASPGEARRLAPESGAALWKKAVRAVQSEHATTAGDHDDRGLYWARLAMTSALKSWAGGDPARAAALPDALHALDYASRGITDTGFPSGPGTTRIMMSGFDPFILDEQIRRSNPSGAIALVMDGKTIQTPNGPAVVQAVMLPVTWSEFDKGIVEDAYGPHLSRGAADADLAITVSQARKSFDIEQWAGANRGGRKDNLNEEISGQVPLSPRWAQPASNPQFIETTLPWRAMVAAGTGPFTVRLNPDACGRDGAGPASCTDDGPKPGWTAVKGGGGDYLSNESMYRVNRLRTALGRTDIGGGHLHTPAIEYDSLTGPELSTAAFAKQRRDIVHQAEALIAAAAAARGIR
ncbi:hypothetical protein [Tsukamurella sp. 1534]|uniref:hypothetical protein n=1 Tax=Tsukamurella sp. 1534 TaxID=1151061 RepID=UPI0002D467E1|nr:hypothetical protein [Tsukamurella sp. 1534]